MFSNDSFQRRRFLGGAAAAALAGLPLRSLADLLPHNVRNHIPIDEQLSALKAYKATETTRPKRIAILGGGMAGMVAAYELQQLQYKPIVVEADGRPGGRVWTKRFDAQKSEQGERYRKQYHELGAMRIPASHDYTRHYVSKFNLRLRPFVTSHAQRNAFYHIDGKITRIRDAKKLWDSYDLSPVERMQSEQFAVPYIMGSHFADVIDSLTAEDVESLFALNSKTPTARVKQLDALTLGDLLSSAVDGKDARRLIGDTTGLSVWFDHRGKQRDGKSLAMFLRDEIVKTGDGLEEIIDGMDQLPKRLAESLGRKSNPADDAGTILYDTEVVGIENVDSGVTLQLKRRKSSGDGIRPEGTPPPEQKSRQFSLQVDYVLCTIPFPVFVKRNIKTNFSQQKWEAIRNLTYASSTKVLLHCRNRFWESKYGIFGGASHSDQISRATYYPSDNATADPRVAAALKPPAALRVETAPTGRRFGGEFTAPASQPNAATEAAADHLRRNAAVIPTAPSPKEVSRGPGVLVGSYSWEADARALGQLSKGDRVQRVKQIVGAFHPELLSDPELVTDSESIFWDAHPWAGRAFCFMAPNDLSTNYPAAISREGRVYFAGEHCSTEPGWIQGALISSLREVRALLEDIAKGK